MMNDKRRIEEEVRKTMESLDQIDRVAPKPFLFTRIMARMQQADSTATRSARPQYRVTLAWLTILVVINVVTISLNFSGDILTSDDSTTEADYFEQYYPALTTIDNISQETTELD